ncbi:hypothetical protein BVRB_5g120040 [Beta vulgaris subsp. vulgaris]|nr:hypothetical protein BVRB_5g120040 [Beta vulgaris subsp. vulgaris]
MPFVLLSSKSSGELCVAWDFHYLARVFGWLDMCIY